jgi:putative intracellular protease/amidase
VQSTEQLLREEHDTVEPSDHAPAVDHDQRRSRLRFAGHYLEMVVAMFAGMLVLGGALRALLAVAGVEYSMQLYPELVTLEMGMTMALGMGAWMRLRGHGWAATLEMSAAMLVPALAVIGLMWLGVLSSGAAMAVEHVAMFPLMLAVMLRRREEYLRHAHTGRVGRTLYAAATGRVARAVGRGLVLLLAFLLLPAAVSAAGSSAYEASRYSQPSPTAAGAAAVAAATPPAHDPGRPTAVVVMGGNGANVADTLVPYEVLSSTGAFNVYVVAPERRPLPLLGGLDVVPDYDFAQLDRLLGGAAPEVTIVPEMPAEESSDGVVTAWLRDTAQDGLLLGVCTGSRLLAAAGLLDGRTATSHWYRLATLERDHREVSWQRGIRYVDDGDVITTGGLLSSLDGTLRVVERLVGPEAAADAAEAVAWRYYSPGKAAPLPRSSLTPGDAVVHLLNVGVRANATTVGVVLTDGVGELELAAAFAPYAEAKAARTIAIAPGGDAVRSRHGLTFVPRADLEPNAVSRVEQLLVPGSAAPDPAIAAVAGHAGVPVTYLHQQPGFAFDEALREMARTTDVPTAQWSAKILEYPSTGLGLTGSGWPWQLALQPLVLGLFGLAVVLGAARWVRNARARRG